MENQTITIDGVEYETEKFDDTQKYLLAQVQDISQQMSRLKMHLDQTAVAQDAFVKRLKDSLEEEAAPEQEEEAA